MAMDGNQATTMFYDTNQITFHGGQFTQNTCVGQSGEAFRALSREVAPLAFYNAGHDFDLPKCHPNTRIAVLDRIKDWTLSSEAASLMWMYGAAGAGKSSIARSIAEWCQKEGILLASFFFRSDPLRNNIKRFIATLAYDITQSVPDSRPFIEHAVELDPHIFSRSLDAQILHLVLKPLSQVAQSRAVAGQPLPHVIIVDGLDECVETREQTSIIRLFSTTLCQNPYFRWKVLIASRPELAIRHSFDDVANPSTWLALSDEYEADEDIKCYLEDNFREIRRRNPNKSHLPSDWPSKEDIDRLVWKSSGQFIYAATVIKFLSSGKRIQARLRTILDVGSTSTNGQAELPFRQLDVLYEHILNSAGAGQVEAVKQTIALCILFESCQFGYVCVCTKRTPGEIIATILDLVIEDVDCILGELCSILKVTNFHVRLYHASVSEFLFDPNRAGNLWVDEGFLWTRIVSHSFRSLITVPKRSLLQWCWIKTLTRQLRHARPTEEVTRCLTFDFTPFFDIHYGVFETWIIFLGLLRTRSLEIDEWKGLYHKHISTYDHWLVRILEDKYSVSYSQRAQVAFLSFRDILDIAVIVPSSELAGIRYSSYLYRRPPGPISGGWTDMFETDQLPKVKAYVLNGEIQASAIIHCVHFLVQCAVTGLLVRFRPGPDRRKSRPWIWRRSRHSPPHIHYLKKAEHPRRSSYAPFIPFSSVLKYMDPLMPMPNKLRPMKSALGSLLRLLNGATISSQLIFALRVALSLTWTSREFENLWREAKIAMTKYLVDEAGLESRMLGFVAPQNIWRDRPWDRFKGLR